MKAIDNVIKAMPEKLIASCDKSGDSILIIVSSDIYNSKKVKKGMYKGYRVQVSDQADKGSVYITTTK